MSFRHSELRVFINLMIDQNSKSLDDGGLVLFFILAFPPWVFSQKASIREVQVKGSNGNWKVSFSVENCFTEKMEEAIQTGIPTTFTFYLQLYQVRSWWKDRKVASLQFQHTIQYSPIRGEYQVTLGEKGTSRVTQNFEEAKRWMAKVEEAEIKPSSEIKPGCFDLPSHQGGVGPGQASPPFGISLLLCLPLGF